MLCEHGEGAALLVEEVDDQPVVRDQPLKLIGELVEEALRVKLLLHRAADGDQRGQEVGQRRAGHVFRGYRRARWGV